LGWLVSLHAFAIYVKCCWYNRLISTLPTCISIKAEHVSQVLSKLPDPRNRPTSSLWLSCWSCSLGCREVSFFRTYVRIGTWLLGVCLYEGSRVSRHVQTGIFNCRRSCFSSLKVRSLVCNSSRNNKIISYSATCRSVILNRLHLLSNHLVRFSPAQKTSTCRTSRPVYWSSLWIWLRLFLNSSENSLQYRSSVLLAGWGIRRASALDHHRVRKMRFASLIFLSLRWCVRLSSVASKFHI